MNNQRFTFLCSKEDRELLDKLAQYFCRSKSDTVRILLHQADDVIAKDLRPGTKERFCQSFLEKTSGIHSNTSTEERRNP